MTNLIETVKTRIISFYYARRYYRIIMKGIVELYSKNNDLGEIKIAVRESVFGKVDCSGIDEKYLMELKKLDFVPEAVLELQRILGKSKRLTILKSV